MSNELTIGIIGLYTIVYLIVFFIQKAQIDRNKDIVSSMKSFMEIFKVDEVKKFVELKEDRLKMSFEKEMNNSENLKNVAQLTLDENMEPIIKLYKKQMGEQHLEMASVVTEYLKIIKPKDRERFINMRLNSVKHIFLPILDEIDNNES